MESQRSGGEQERVAELVVKLVKNNDDLREENRALLTRIQMIEDQLQSLENRLDKHRARDADLPAMTAEMKKDLQELSHQS